MLKRKFVWLCRLSKDGEDFEKKYFQDLKDAMQWADELRLVDHYVVNIENIKDPSNVIRYICDRDPKNINLTKNLFAPFKD